MHRLTHVTLAVLLGTAVTLGATPSIRASGATEATTTTRVVDRTLVCTTGVQGGARVLFLRAQSAYPRGSTLEWLAQATVSTQGQPVPSKPDYRPTLAGVTAGWPPPKLLTSGGLAFAGRRCTTTPARVSFSRRDLTGGLAGPLGDELQCIVPRSLLVRVRAIFREPVDLKLVQGSYATIGRIAQGQVAVRTAAGKPLVYADVTDSGRARLFTARGCS